MVRNFEEIPYERMVTRLHLRNNDVNPGRLSVYVYMETQLRKLSNIQ